MQGVGQPSSGRAAASKHALLWFVSECCSWQSIVLLYLAAAAAAAGQAAAASVYVAAVSHDCITASDHGIFRSVDTFIINYTV